MPLMPNVNKSRIESGHHLLHRAEIDISHRERDVLLLSPELHQSTILEDRDEDLLRSHIDDKLTFHTSKFNHPATALKPLAY